MHLTKSLYLTGLQCKKALWIKTHRSEVLEEPDSTDMAIIKTGTEVGEFACGLFPGGKRILFSSPKHQKIELTQQWISDGVENIYEAAFEFDDVLVMVDILHRDEEGCYEIYEVKGSTWNSKEKLSELSNYISDASIQYYVLNGCGINISKVSITLLNSDYTREDELDIHQLFVCKDVTQEVVDLQNNIPRELEEFRKTLRQSNIEPDVEIGWHCNNPRKCKAKNHCWINQRGIPKFSVFNVFPLTKESKSLDLYHQGIIEVKDIPNDFELTDKQRFIVDSCKNTTSDSAQTDNTKISEFLDSLNYPLYHLDFETFALAIPEHKGARPFQKTPFQYSVHIEQEGQSIAEIDHKEFLGKQGTDPREELVKQLVEDIPKNVTVLAYSKGFEKGVLSDLAEQFNQHKTHLLNISRNMVDLADPFRKRYFYLPKMMKRYGLKTVLPLLVPRLQNAYKELDLIHDGKEAMHMYIELSEVQDEDEVKRKRKALLEYCKLDTLAMVEILAVLRNTTTQC